MPWPLSVLRAASLGRLRSSSSSSRLLSPLGLQPSPAGRTLVTRRPGSPSAVPAASSSSSPSQWTSNPGAGMDGPAAEALLAPLRQAVRQQLKKTTFSSLPSATLACNCSDFESKLSHSESSSLLVWLQQWTLSGFSFASSLMSLWSVMLGMPASSLINLIRMEISFHI